MTPQGRLRVVTGLTLARYPLVLGFFGAAVVQALGRRPELWVVALGLLAASALTDLVDGYLARRFRVQTTFGAHADPLMDKFFYLSSLPVLVFLAAHRGEVEHAVMLLVLTVGFLARDQWVTFLRAVSAPSGVDGRAHWSGKLRTAVNFPLIVLIYVYEAAPIRWCPAAVMYTAESVAFLLNALSVVFYTRRYWPYVRTSLRTPGGAVPL